MILNYINKSSGCSSELPKATNPNLFEIPNAAVEFGLILILLFSLYSFGSQTYNIFPL